MTRFLLLVVCFAANQIQVTGKTCGENDWKCKDNSTCAVLCDKYVECPSKEDEAQCSHKCKIGQVYCKGADYWRCVDTGSVCNGVKDCKNGEDEAICPQGCLKFQYKCSDSTCVNDQYLCDGSNDCTDGGDEANCPELVNLAFDRPTSQSTTHGNKYSSIAVDGTYRGDFDHCTHTQDTSNVQILEWWAVDLGRPYTITKVKIFGRSECCQERLKHFKMEAILTDYRKDANFENIEVGKTSLCHHRGDTETTNLEVDCLNTYGNIFRIKHTERLILTLCEVEVYGRPYQLIKADRSLATDRQAQAKTTYELLPADAWRAIDGSDKFLFNEESCFHSAQNPTVKEWWAVSLDDVYIITQVTVHGRSDCCPEQLGDVDIEVIQLAAGNELKFDTGTVSLCFYQTDPTYYIDAKCPENQRGNYVRLIHRGQLYLSFCEVLVYGVTDDDVTLRLQGQSIARGKQTAASAVFKPDEYGHPLAVDGDYSQNAENLKKCFISDMNIYNQWWAVDLGYKYKVGLIALYGRDENVADDNLREFDIEVIDPGFCKPGDFKTMDRGVVTKCMHQPYGRVNMKTRCLNTAIGQFVRIYSRIDQHLSICEVEVYGIQIPFKYGKTDNTMCDDYRCIPKEYECDGVRDCPDAEDEIECTRTCSGDQFKCDTGMCISKFKKCDGIEDCSTGEDEHNCTDCGVNYKCDDDSCVSVENLCKETSPCKNQTTDIKCCFECYDGQCIKTYKICDGTKDCEKGEDEKFCSKGCGSGMRSCKNESTSFCIPFYKQCDMQQDCPLAEDELSCNTSFALPTTTEEATTTELQTTTTELQTTTTELQTTTTELQTTTTEGMTTTGEINETTTGMTNKSTTDKMKTTTKNDHISGCILNSSAPLTAASVLNVLLGVTILWRCCL